MAWLDNKKVDALWAINEEANSWAWIDGAWRKFDDNASDITTNFTILGAHAKETNSNVKVRVEDGRVKEMYVW